MLSVSHAARATLPGSRPREYRPPKAESAALLIHGYTGRPKDMIPLAEHLADAGFAVSVPRLPGAGTDMDDLASTRRRDWRRRVYDAWLDLRSEFSRVHLVGYSMGGILALDLASRVEPERIALLAPGMQTSHALLKFTPLLAPFAPILPEVPTGWVPREEDDEETREHGRRYWSRRDVKSAAQLLRLQRETRRRLRRVSAPVMAVVSRDDASVPVSVLDFLDRRLPRGLGRRLVIEGCGHDVPQGTQKDRVAEAVASWLTEAAQ